MASDRCRAPRPASQAATEHTSRSGSALPARVLGHSERRRLGRRRSHFSFGRYGAGAVRLSLGDNRELGGEVRGNYMRWFFFTNATVHVDFRYLVRNGVLQRPDTN